MTVYNVVLFAHITSVIIMFASLTADWLAVGGLRTTESAGRQQNPTIRSHARCPVSVKVTVPQLICR